VRGCTSHF